MTKETKPNNLVLIADVNGNQLYRVGNTGSFNGDFWFEADGDEGFIDTGYLIKGGEFGDEAQLIKDFTQDYA